ncbi:MAG: LysR family transcriptional regulator [Pseudomonadota bacterium]
MTGIRRSTNWPTLDFDWNQVKAFLATAEEGSLSAAARALGLTQPTLSRQVSGLESDLGITLFERGHRSMALTDAGIELLDHVRAMGEAATRVSLTASGQSQTIEGQVSVTATNVLATYHLPAIVRRTREVAPGIALEIIASNELRDLRRREADIAIRHSQPREPDLVARRIGDLSGYLYAASGYLDRLGRPQQATDLGQAAFIGFEKPDRLVATYRHLGIPVEADHFKVYTASGTLIMALMEAEVGIGVATHDVAQRCPGLERVLPSLPAIDVPVWLVTHRELYTSRRIRLVFDEIAASLIERFAMAEEEAGDSG